MRIAISNIGTICHIRFVKVALRELEFVFFLN